jgi:hypothetical protein
MTLDAALQRIRIEFEEMPDLKLTLPQVRRLCDVPDDICGRAVETLVEAGVLRRTDNGRIVGGLEHQPPVQTSEPGN